METRITRESIIAELENRGYRATPHDVMKNGVTLSGISIRAKSDVAPCFYVEDFIERFDNCEDIAECIINLYECNRSINFDISLLSNHEWVLEHLYIGLQKASSEMLIKKDSGFDDIEQYLYIRGTLDDDTWSAKLSLGIMDVANITEEEAWATAKSNTFANGETVISNITEILGNMLGDPCLSEIGFEIPMYVVTNRSKNRGSAQILNTESIRRYFSSLPQQYTKLVLIPSSIHEFIIVPTADEVVDLDAFNVMVSEVNAKEVAETEQLGSHCYILSL